MASMVNSKNKIWKNKPILRIMEPYCFLIFLDDGIMMLEADVNLGYLEGQPQDGNMIPSKLPSIEKFPFFNQRKPLLRHFNFSNLVMAHPPTTVSDLSLEQFMATTVEAILNGGKRKGIKLDFKTVDIVEDSLKIMEQFEVISGNNLNVYRK